LKEKEKKETSLPAGKAWEVSLLWERAVCSGK